MREVFRMQKPEARNPEAATQQDSAQPAPKAEPAKGCSPPASAALEPDKTAEVPKYCVCLGSDSTVAEGEINAVAPKEPAE